MDSIKQLNLAMRYIEEHLTEEIDFARVFQIACCSEYHFRRVFSFLAGISLGEYVRLRRLTHAALLLKNSEAKIIDVALSLGYESPDSFTKAFQAFHGTLPSEVKKNNARAKSFLPMTFQLHIQGGNEMIYRIVNKESFKIVGLKKRITLQFSGVNKQMDSMWAEFKPEDFVELKQISDMEPKGIICASANFSNRLIEGSELDQYIGVASTNEFRKRWDSLLVDAGTWAVFTAVGEFPTELQNIWSRIYTEWLPQSGYELVEGPEILWNESPDTSKADYKSEIWVPIRQK